MPLNAAHFLQRALAHTERSWLDRQRLQAIYHGLSFTMTAIAAASRKTAGRFDRLTFRTLARSYTEQLGRLFVNAGELGFEPSWLLLYLFGLSRTDLEGHDDVVSVEVAERNADRTKVVVEAL